MRASTAQAIEQAARDRQRRLHALNRLKAAQRRQQRELDKLRRRCR